MTRSLKRVIFRADAGARLGGGHVMRCLTLADALVAIGWSVGFAVATGTLDVLPRLARITDVFEATSKGLAPAALAHRWPQGCDVLVVDHYELDAGFEATCRGWADRIMVIDDLANRVHDCDLLVDASLGRDCPDYAGLVPSDALVLAGTNYALLRPEFVALRHAGALPRRAARDRVERVLVSLGLTDIGGMTRRAVDALLTMPATFEIDVVIGASAASAADLSALANVAQRLRLHIDPPNLADLFAEADLAIGAGGTTSWERCCLGLPTIMLVLADNQQVVAAQLEKVGAAKRAEPDRIGEVAAALIENVVRLRQMAKAAATVVDGRGTDRIVTAMRGLAAVPAMKSPIKLRPPVPEDSAVIWNWRNDPQSRANFRHSDIVPWAEHDRWFQDSLDNPKRTFFIGVLANEPIGVVRFDHLEHADCEVSINLAADGRGKGLGKNFLSLACRAFFDFKPNAVVYAEIKATNDASLRIFFSSGFKSAGDREGYVVVRRDAKEHGSAT
jgi:UDP-2,4-diacetamido-2,4,6-trideoxy-beta-L-altropyranose hydrolase